ncbi:MAG: aldo/keto reductase [Planctomycetaceae bacterium]
MKTSTQLTLRSGDSIPAVGLGMWKVSPGQSADLILAAAGAGYRHFDCACDYGNEQEVGSGFKRLFTSEGYSREEFWITSKLWNTFHRPEHVEIACRKSLDDLQLDFLDLYLIHFPIAQRFVPIEQRYPPGWIFDPAAPAPKMEFDRVPIIDTWRAMERLQQQGLTRNIGVCNFGTSLLRDLLASATIPPAVLQVESHPYLTQEKLLKFCQQEQIVYTAFSPFGSLSYHELGMASPGDNLLEVPPIPAIAAAHRKTPAQVLLRWGIQRGTSVIPKTSNQTRLRENLDVFSFELTDQEMQSISALNQSHRYNDPGHFCQTAFNTFCPIYE